VKIGIMLDPQEGMPWERWRHLVALVEALGFESLWRSDHVTSLVGQPQRATLEAWTSLTYVATATTRLRFSTLVSPITFRHPSLLALAAAAIDDLSRGRLEVGIGAGWFDGEHRAFGIPFPRGRDRFAMLDEGIAVMKLLWSGEEVSFRGRFYTLDGAVGHPRPAQRPHPPIVVGGAGKRLLGIAARHADEWNVYGQTPESYRPLRDVLERQCEAAGRDPTEITRSVAAPFAVGRSSAEFRRRAARLLELFPLPKLVPAARAGLSADALRSLGWFAGSPDNLAEQLEALAAEGVGRLILQHNDFDDDASLELLAERLLPGLTPPAG
jgi:F420-dependent oxidoreductase-like protein